MNLFRRLSAMVPGRQLLIYLLICLFSVPAFSQPANDNCANASIVSISNSGFGLGIFTSSTFDLTSATVQPSETFAPAILVAGQNQKSIWYKFTVPTTRSVRVTLAQPGSAITAGDAGFAVYKTNNCLPTNADISTKLTPIGLFGNSFHPCVESGVYLVQVSGKATANGPVYITVELGYVNAIYDKPSQAYDFGTINQGVKTINYPIGCHSTEDAAEVCTALSNYQDYNKSTWHVFRTPAYFDYLSFFLACNNPYLTYYNFGYTLYRGDVRSTPYTSLPVVDGCDSLQTYRYSAAQEIYMCGELDPNTTYSIQIFYHKDFDLDVQVTVGTTGNIPTQAPEPILSGIPAPTNSLGVLPSSPSGINTYASDFLACNSRHALHPCNPSLPANGVLYGNYRYNLSSFFTFTLASTSNLYITHGVSSGYYNCGYPYLIRLYNQGVSNNCATLDPANIISETTSYPNLTCVPPGNYTIQVLGLDTASYPYGYGSFNNSSLPPCSRVSLGQKFDLNINVKTITAINRYSLASTGAFDSINVVAGVMQPLTPGNTYYSKTDTFGCANTVLPWDTACAPGYTKAIYREFVVADSGIVNFYSGGYWLRLYKGDADALSTAQNVHYYPQRITGLEAYTQCLTNTQCGMRTCVVPGTYTLVTFGSNAYDLGRANQSRVGFDTVNTTHNSPDKAENMGDILSVIPSTGGNISSGLDYYSCKDNAVPINGYMPCTINNTPVATKAIYRQFYLSRPAIVTIGSYHNSPFCGPMYGGPNTLFKGKATDGLDSLTVMPSPWQCFNTAYLSGQCNNEIPAGWYTIVSYGTGPTYQNPFQSLNDFYGYGSFVGATSQITIYITVPQCPGPKYNRPYKAALDTTINQPFLIQWGPRVGNTSAYPKTDTTYTLYTENFNCTVDTPFSSHPITNCDPSLTKVAYYVFRTTQESFVQINTQGLWGAVYAGNARTDSASFANAVPIQPCLASYDHIEICKMQPGVYTLVIFAPSNYTCNNVTPTIYIDKIGYSRFDHANNAYDFGLIPPDNVYHNGKAGDVNPLDPGRAPSNDFFYCTTGSQANDPDQSSCYLQYMPGIYNPGVNNVLYNSSNYNGSYYEPTRNLWYTFTVDKGGWVKIKVANKTIGKQYQYSYDVYKSNVNGTLAFPAVVATGQVDSTITQGLTLITSNKQNAYCFGNDEINFYRDPCSPVPERYYILVENRNPYPYADPHVMAPSSQVEVSVLMDSINVPAPQFDHYYQASNIGINLSPGTYNGVTDNFSCATRDATDPLYGNICNKTLWYKFSTNVSGVIRYRIFLDGQTSNNYTYGYYLQLFRQVIPGDSTSNGLQIINPNGTTYNDGGILWGQECISPGTYYIILPGCARINEYVYPQIQLIEQEGDYCSRPVVATLNGAGTNVSSVLVNCHTIGTDYGEFNPTLTCPAGAITNQYKTSWFRIDITGTDTLDVTTYLTENTNATSTDIKYRLMNGNCGAMQERSCVQDALTQDTYKCLPPGSYWVQVFTPVSKNGSLVTGTIDLHLSAVHHADTCAPINPCLSNANFQKQFDCTVSEAVRFINYSTFGAAVTYNWDFGYNGQTSTAVSPQFVYPALTINQTYYITLTVTNNSCGGITTYNDSITIPPRPGVFLGNDTSLCNGGSVLLNATSHPGSVYYWQNGSTAATYLANTTGSNIYHVRVTYNGCIARDTIRINIDPINPRTLNKYICSGDPVLLDAARGFGESYLWNTGAISSSVSVYNPGIYWADISLNGCITRDSFIVATTASPLGNDRQVCFGTQPVILNATTAGAVGYTWQNGSTASTFTAPTAGLYWVNISFGNCSLRDTIVLSNYQAVLGSMNAIICQGQSYTLPSGHIVTTADTYSDTVRSAGGCDSLINVVNLSVQAVTVINLNAAICPGQTYTLPWGTVVSATNIYRDTLRYTTGCDSIRRIVNLVVNSASSSTTNTSVCPNQLPYNWNGANYNAAGTYVYHTLNAVGCDSAATLNLTIKATSTSTTNSVICSDQLPFNWNGTNYNVSGTYVYHTLNSVGCDSAATLNLIVKATSASITNTTICSDQLPFNWNGTNYNTSGSYVYHTLNAVGCDSAAALNLTVKATSTSTTNTTICSDQLPFSWNGINYNAAGTYVYHALNAVGCDSAAALNLIVKATSTSTTNTTVCSDQLPFNWNGTNYNATGAYVYHTLNAVGCDSAATLNLTVKATSASTTNTTICSNQLPFNWNGSNYNISGTYVYHTLNAVGCDSAATLNLIVKATSTSTTNTTVCSDQLPFNWNGTNYNTSGTYVYHELNSVGCDSAATLNLLIKAISTSTTNTTICSNQLPFNWNGINYNAGGTFVYHTLNSVGCDSAATLNLVVMATSTSTTNTTICSNQLPYNWNGNNYNTSGTYVYHTLNAVGCDSAATLNLIVKATSTSTTNTTVCSDQLPFNWNGTNYNTSGTYVYHTLNSIGCDSAATLNLLVKATSTSSTNTTVCSDQLPYNWNGTNYNTSGTYVYHTLNSVGCDSAATLNLVVKATSTSTTNTTICSNQLPYNWNGINYNAVGTFVYHTLNSVGCDSAATLNLVVKATSTSTTNTTICSNQLPYNWNGTNYINAGTYVYHTVNAVGCDSAATLNLTVKATSASTTNTTVCSDQLPYNWNGTNYNASGTYVYHTINAVGCDSAATLNLVVKATSASTTNTTICSNQLPYNWNGTNYNAAGTYVYHTLNAAGCDSATTLNLTIKATSVSTTNTTICSNQLPYNWNGTNYNVAGTYVYHTLNAVGCDSAATLNLTVKATSTSTSNTTICSNQLPYNWNGTNYNVGGIYVYHTLNAVGCDSAATLNLIVTPTSTSTTNTAVCPDQLPYNWNGTNYNVGGTYIYHTLNAVGCDSAATLNLVIKTTSTSTTNTTICSDQLPFTWNGTNYNGAGTYVYHTINAVGCDSAATLNLAVQPPASQTLSPVICAGQTYVLPWGAVVNASGIYRDTLHYATGCDSIRRIVNLTVQSPASQTFNPVICQGGAYTLPWGVVVNTAGTYRDTLHYRTGCDSVRRTVNLTVTAAAVSTTSATICSDEIYTLPWGTVTNIAGIYKDTVRTRFGCDSLIRTVNLRVDPAPLVSVTKSNDVDCMLGIAKLEASGGVSYTWTPAASLNNAAIYNPIASPTTSTWYKVLVTSDKGCTTEDSVQVKVITGNIQNGYLVPNAFTPNGDGKNDCFGVQTWGYVTDFSLSVFNRWGQRIFYTTKPSDCWDGTYKGKEQNPDVYVYQITAKGFCGDIYRKGTFTLIR